MKTGRNLNELAMEIARRAANKRDFTVAPAAIRMSSYDYDMHKPGDIGVWIGEERFGVTAHAHTQIAKFTDIPMDYYKRLLEEAPSLLATNVNQWIDYGDNRKKIRMVRTLDSNVRALLSDGYRRLEDEDLAEAVLPVLEELGLDIMSCEITDRRLYIKAVDPRVTRQLKAAGGEWGDGRHNIIKTRTAMPAVTIANSQTGEGRLSVLGGLYDKWCSNLASFGERSVRKTHLGSRNELAPGEELYELLSDDTKRLTDQALWAQVRDTVRNIFNLTKFHELVDKVEATSADAIESDNIPKVVEVTAKKFGLGGAQKNSVLKHLIEGGELSRFGLYNAVTRASQDQDDYDEATRMEILGGKIIELAPREWATLAKAA
jgi:hypothetical protein